MKFVLQILMYCLGVFFLKAQNVGIGTTSPTEKLEVLGNIKGVNLLATGSLSLTNTSSQTTWTVSINTINNYLSVSNNGASIMTITTAGRVGIGVATPIYTLEVAGSLNASAATFDGNVVAHGFVHADQSVSVDGNVTVDGNITVNNGFGIMRNANSATQLKYFTFSNTFTFTSFAGHTLLGPYQVNFSNGANFTSTPRVMTANYTSISGTAGHLFSIIPAIISVTNTGFQIYFYNSSTATATMDFTLSFVCIGN